MDQIAKQALAAKLQGHMKKASSNIKNTTVFEKDDYKIVLSSNDITQYFKNEKVGSTKIAEFDDETIEFINSNRDEAAAEMLDGFRSNFNVEEWQQAEKTAANKELDEETAQKVTQKQFDDQKVSLHPRTDDYYPNVTQKQLPEHGQRPGTYDQVTEGQFRDERTTFYGADRTAGDWTQEDRNIVTEGQFEEGVKEYSEVGESDRGEIGSKFDGELDKQWKMTGEKQLMELLKHHEWTEPLTITEGPEQLQKQDGELSRITAEIAGKITKEALDILGKTVLAAGATPDQLATIVRRLVSHHSKYPVLAHTIACYAGSDISNIEKKVAKARHFGKTANTSIDYSDNLIADVFVRQLSKLSYSPQFVVEGLVALAEQSDFSEKITQACDECISNEDEVKEANSNINIFRQVLADETKYRTVGSDEDGVYSFTGKIAEVEADITDRQKFAEAAVAYSKPKILTATEKDIDLIPQAVNVSPEDGEYEAVFVEASKKEAELQARAEARRALAKEAAETKEAETKETTEKTAQMGGAGGMPPAAGPEMGNPQAPPGAADMGAPPPGEALSQDPLGEEDLGEGGTGEPQPPGAVCPACGNNDVDVDNGEMRCNNCGAEGTVSIKLDMTKWPETIQETEMGEEEGFGLGAEEEGLGLGGDMGGAELGGEGEGTTMPNVPVGASVKVKDILQKIASTPSKTVIATTMRVTPRMLETLKEQKIKLGSVCPTCGGHNTDLIKSASKGQDGVCWSCLQEYNFKVVASKDKKNNVAAQYVWTPKSVEPECKGCNRLKEAFNQSLKNYGVTRNDFDNLRSIKERGDFVLKMAKAGSLDLEVAMEEKLPIERFASQSKFDKFPSASCRERISRRFGENATAMSGPCEGKKLANCVCDQLETLGTYTDGLAAKVANLQASNDPMIHSPMKTCIAMFVRDNYDYDDACTACDGLRAAHANVEDLVIESIAQINPAMPRKPMPKPMPAPTEQMKPAPMKAMPEAPAAKHLEAPTAPSPMPIPGTAPSPMEAPGAPSPMEAPTATPSPMEAPAAPPSPMEMGGTPSPMDQPVTDATDLGGDLGGGLDDSLGDEMGGDIGLEIGGDFGDEGLDIGLEGDTVSIELPAEAVDAFQVLFDALQGQLSDDFMDVGDITEDTVGNDFGSEEPGLDETPEHEEAETPEFEAGEETEEEEGGIPGLADDDDVPSFGGEEDESDDMEKSMLHKKTKCDEKPCGMPMEEKPMPIAESTEETTKEASNELDGLLFGMKTGTLKNTQTSLDNVFDGLFRQAHLAKEAANDDVKKMEYKGASEGDKIKTTPAQDSTEVKYKDDGKIGHEETFSSNVATNPSVPRAAATIGDEDNSNTLNDKTDIPTVPHGSPAMAGEKHYRPEKGNVVDGNQSAQTTATSKKEKKTANQRKDCQANTNPSKGVKNMKTASIWTVQEGHQHYEALKKKADAGEQSVKLQDGNTYDMIQDQNNNFVLIAQNSKKIKESQSVSPKKVDDLESDPDINQSSGAGKGKVKEDKTHSLAITEQKPSEGVEEASKPEAPNAGQLTREHTVDNKLDGPTIPAGGGSNPEYDTVEKYDPEKLDQMLGKQNDIAAMASHDEAVKIAGQMVKANLISIDELQNKVKELSQATPEIIRDYENMIRAAYSKKGMQKEASADAVENPALVQKTAETDTKNQLKNDIQSLFRLDGRNRDHERYNNEQGSLRLFH